MNSPWGAIQTCRTIAPGIISVTTASHGGLHVAPDLLAKMPEAMRSTPYSRGGWFEEDCDWALVAVSFPEAFGETLVQAAKRTIASVYPELVT